MVLSIIKEQLNHDMIRKVNVDEGKDPFTWWRLHEGQFSNVVSVV
jgi:hypothetical protein